VPGLKLAHFQPRKSTVVETRNYNKKGIQSHAEWIQFKTKGPNYGKDADFLSFGTPLVKQGTRMDIIRAKQMIDEGATNREIADYDFALYARLYKAIDRYRSMKKPSRNDPPMVILLQGPPDTGKTRWAYTTYPDLWEPAIAMDRAQWFDGYDSQTTVLLDEFEGIASI